LGALGGALVLELYCTVCIYHCFSSIENAVPRRQVYPNKLCHGVVWDPTKPLLRFLGGLEKLAYLTFTGAIASK